MEGDKLFMVPQISFNKASFPYIALLPPELLADLYSTHLVLEVVLYDEGRQERSGREV